MRSLLLILPSAFLILSSPIVCSQTLNDCSNLGLELGTFQGWRAGYGTWSVDPATKSPLVESQGGGFQPEQHRIRHRSEGNVRKSPPRPSPSCHGTYRLFPLLM